MIQKKRLKMFLLSAIFSMSVFADPVILVNGNAVEKLASKITLSGDNVIVRFSDGIEQTYDMSSVIVNFFTTTDISLNDVSFSSVTSLVENTLFISGISEGSEIFIYSMDGKVLYNQKVNSSELSLNLSDYKSAVYFLTVNNQVIRFIKK